MAPTPAAPAPAEGRREPDAFNFDLNFAPASSPVSSPVPPAPKPAPQPTFAAPTPAAVPSPAAAPSAPASTDYDSIADLIAAELLGDTQPEPTPAAAAAAPVVAAPAPQAARPAVSGGLVVDQDERAERRQPSFDSPVAPPKPRGDSFKIPPVFGLGTRPVTPAVGTTAPTPSEPRIEAPIAAAPVAPDSSADDTLGTDPIDEIENLIGRAVRVDMDSSAPANPAEERPQPALLCAASPRPRWRSRPLSRRAPFRMWMKPFWPLPPVTGADIGWVETPDAEEAKPGKRRIKAERAPRAPRNFNFSRALAGPVVAIVLLAAAGFGLYWVPGMGGESGPPPVLTADATPIKETPAAQPATGAAQQSVVFNEIDGVQPGSDEQLVSRDQADVNEVTRVASSPSVSEEGSANRKVRTVTVRPDGTIVSGEETVAGSAILPVDRPNVPEVPGAETASPELLAAAAQPEPPPTPVVPPVTPVTPGATVPAVDAAGNPIAGKTTIVPRTRPASFAQQTASAAPATTVDAIINNAAEPAATPAPTPAPAASTAAIPAGATEVEALPNDAPAYVQLASQRSEAEARQTARAMVSRFGPLFGGANMEVQRVDTGARGVFYRVRVPANSIQSANDMCTQVKAAGGDCFTM
ncbi:SPOR domain-containing protein [Devosia sp. A8/3-2]|nr:SPOR domain-containing protein [Devosia sp. A8/3-2]